MDRLEASVSLSPDDEIGLDNSYLVTMRLCFGFCHMSNKGLEHSAVERGSLVVMALAEVGVSVWSSDDNKKDAKSRVQMACWMSRERWESAVCKDLIGGPQVPGLHDLTVGYALRQRSRPQIRRDFCCCYVSTVCAPSEFKGFVRESLGFSSSLTPVWGVSEGRTRCEIAKDMERGSGRA